jgi:hypothetical protein
MKLISFLRGAGIAARLHMSESIIGASSLAHHHRRRSWVGEAEGSAVNSWTLRRRMNRGEGGGEVLQRDEPEVAGSVDDSYKSLVNECGHL